MELEPVSGNPFAGAGSATLEPVDFDPFQKAGKSLNRSVSDIPRQFGLTARYALEGPAQAAQIVTEPIAGLMRWAGIPTRPLGEIASGAADAMGLPKPHTAQERVVGDATRLLAGTGGMLGASRAIAQLPGMVGTVGAGMAANPTAQLTSATGAGVMGGLSREGGGNEMQQAGAALIGGVAGGMVPGAANAAVNAGKRLSTGSRLSKWTCRSATSCNAPGWTTARCRSVRASLCARRCRTPCEQGRSWTPLQCAGSQNSRPSAQLRHAAW